MNPIGGYFELELRKGEEYHKNAIRLNSGRNAFEYILRAKGFKKIYIPYFTCDVMLEPINKLKLNYEFYHINLQFEPIFDFNIISDDEAFIYINYFGIKRKAVEKLSKICSNLIIDNTQAFFEKPLPEIDTFYSVRKFFGIPDGAYLYTDTLLQVELSQDKSFTRFSHLIKRIDDGAEAGYKDFKANDNSLKGQSIKLMSALTQALLCNIDYNEVIKVRKNNFLSLSEYLNNSNELKIPKDKSYVPMVYPYLAANGKNLKQNLIQKGIFVATYWPNVLEWSNPDDVEFIYTHNIVYLPIDQRICIEDLAYVINIISENGK